MKRVVSPSLGSSTRNKKVEVTIKGETISVERIGCDGDLKKMKQMYEDLDGKVDAFGVGGINAEIRIHEKRYPIRAATALLKGVTKTPVVDGGGLKETLESQIMQYALQHMDQPLGAKRAMMTVGIERMGMAESIANAGYEMVFCDFMFALGVPIPIYSVRNALRLGHLLVPVMIQLPFSMLYPTGEEEEKIKPKYEKWYHWGSVVAGDFLYIRHHMPDRLDGTTIVTNTTTADDVELLRQRGVKYLVTSTPRMDGRSFGTNLMEAMLVALAGKRRPLTDGELREAIQEFDLHPDVQKLI